MSNNLLVKKPGHPLQELATDHLTPSKRPAPLPREDATDDLGSSEPEATVNLRPRGAANKLGLPRVEGYEILDELGRGGMGVVYKAWQHNLQRTVALKMILSGSFAGAQELDRFRAEAMAIARLHHPHLLSIYDIGETNHLPYYAMEYMEGGSLSRRLNGQPIAPRTAATLVRSLAQAMDYAHKNGIVHRDLKPANILLTGDKDTPLEQTIAKITDFGIAKHLHQNSSYTKTGDILGTPNYMAPEQAMGRTGQIGPAADVYSLGAILYELLTGRPPFEGENGADVLILVVKEEPERPSYWARSLPRDLETICLKCLEKDPARRYQSGAQLADDLNRYLHSEPIQARAASFTDRSVKWMRRRPAMAAMLLMAIASAIVGFGVMAMFLHQAVDHAQAQDDLVTQSKILLADAYLERGIHLAEKKDVRRGMHWMVRALAMTEEIERRQKQPSLLEPVIRMNLATWSQCVAAREMTLHHNHWVWDVAFSPDQQFVFTAGKDARVQVWNARTGQAIGAPLEHPFPVWGMAIHPDGQTIFTVCGDDNISLAGWLCVWSADADRPGHFTPRRAPVMFPYPLTRLAMNPQGDRLLVASATGQACLLAFDPQGAGSGLGVVGAPLAGLHQLPAFSTDGALLATIAVEPNETGSSFVMSNQVQLWDARSGETLGEPLEHRGPVRTVAFSKDGTFVIVGATINESIEEGETSQIVVWDGVEGICVAKSPPLNGRIKSSATAPNGQMFAVSHFEYIRPKEKGARLHITDGHVGLWQIHDDGRIELYGPPLRTNHVVWHMQFSPDSRMLLAGSESSGAFLFSVANGQHLLAPIWHEGNCVKVAFSADGRLAVTASAGGNNSASARLWEVPTFSHFGPPLPQPKHIRSAFWEKDGKHVWMACGDAICRWDPLAGAKTEEIRLPDYFYYALASGDDRQFLFLNGKEELHRYSRDTGKVTPLPHNAKLHHHNGNFENWWRFGLLMQSWSRPSRIQLLDLDGKALTPLRLDADYERTAYLLSPQGDCLAVAQNGKDRKTRLLILNIKDLSVRREIPLKHPVSAMAFRPDGKTIAVGGSDRQIQHLDLATGAVVGVPLLHESNVLWARYLGNDRHLVTSGEKGYMLLWDVPTGKRIGPAFEHNADLMTIAARPDSKVIVTGTTGRIAMSWRISEPMAGSLADIRLRVETMTGMEMTENDTIVPLSMEQLLERRERLNTLQNR